MRQLDHIVLIVAGTEADGMQLQHFPCEVFIDPAASRPGTRAVRTGAAVLIEIDQHHRRACHGTQHITEGPRHMRADCLLHIGHRAVAQHPPLADNGEMVRPERHQPFAKPVRGGGAPEQRVPHPAHGICLRVLTQVTPRPRRRL